MFKVRTIAAAALIASAPVLLPATTAFASTASHSWVGPGCCRGFDGFRNGFGFDGFDGFDGGCCCHRHCCFDGFRDGCCGFDGFRNGFDGCGCCRDGFDGFDGFRNGFDGFDGFRNGCCHRCCHQIDLDLDVQLGVLG